MCQVLRGVQGRRTFAVLLSTPARIPEPLARGHGWQLVRAPTRSPQEQVVVGRLWTVKSLPSLCIFSHIAHDRIDSSSTFCLRTHSPALAKPRSPCRRSTKDTKDRALPSHFVTKKTRSVLLIGSMLA